MDVIALEGNGIRPSHRGGGYSEEGKMYTLNTIERHSVCYEMPDESKDGEQNFHVESCGHEISYTQFARGGAVIR